MNYLGGPLIFVEIHFANIARR